MRILSVFKDALNDMTNRLFLTLIIIIQLVVALVVLFNGLNFTYSNYRNMDKIKSLYDVGNINKIQMQNDTDNFIRVRSKEEDFGEKINEYNDFCQNSSDFSCVRFTRSPVFIKYYKDCDKFSLDGKDQVINNIKYTVPCTLQGDKNYFDTFKYDLIEGRNFEEDDFKRENSEKYQEVPIILGNNYSSVYGIGDTIMSLSDDSDQQVKLRVIGILAKNQYFTDGGLSAQGLYNTDNYILYPIKDLKSNLTNEDVNEFLQSFFDSMIISKKDSEYLEKIINEKAKSLNLFEAEIQNGEDKMQYNYDMITKLLAGYLIIFFILILFTSINVITSMTSYIQQKKKELAINVLCGANRIDLSLRIFFQNFIMIFFSCITSYGITRALNAKSMVVIRKEVVLVVVFICILLLLLISIIPVIKLYSLDLNAKIKED